MFCYGVHIIYGFAELDLMINNFKPKSAAASAADFILFCIVKIPLTAIKSVS